MFFICKEAWLSNRVVLYKGRVGGWVTERPEAERLEAECLRAS